MCALSGELDLFTFNLAYVMDEYRDPKFAGGYVAGKYLFNKTAEQDQKAFALCGRYDLHLNVTLYSHPRYASLTRVPESVRLSMHLEL